MQRRTTQKHNASGRGKQSKMKASPLTLVTGSIRLTPCLLIAISNVSGKVGSVDCCNKYQHISVSHSGILQRAYNSVIARYITLSGHIACTAQIPPIATHVAHSWSVCCLIVGHAFSALTLLVGRQEEHAACRNWVMRWWCGYLSGARCRLFAYGPAIAIPKPRHLLPHLNPDWFYHFWYWWLTQVVLEMRPLNGCSSSSSCRSHTLVSPVKAAEPIEMLPDGRLVWTQATMYRTGMHIGATWQIRLNDWCMWVKLLWSLVEHSTKWTHLHFKESGSKGRPPVGEFQELSLCIPVWHADTVLVMRSNLLSTDTTAITTSQSPAILPGNKPTTTSLPPML